MTASTATIAGTGHTFGGTGAGSAADPFIMNATTGAPTAGVAVPGTGKVWGVQGSGTKASPYVLCINQTGSSPQAYNIQNGDLDYIFQLGDAGSFFNYTGSAGTSPLFIPTFAEVAIPILPSSAITIYNSSDGNLFISRDGSVTINGVSTDATVPSKGTITIFPLGSNDWGCSGNFTQ